MLREQAGKKLSEGRSFLAENSKKEGVKNLPSGLQYRIITEGTGRRQRQPTPSRSITVEL
jgi:FKBP-type peptidyl-prolyl cis-trans isomerase FklB